MKKHESSVISLSDSEALEARKKIYQIMNNYPSTEDEKERSLGLFLRGSLLARIFGIREIYEQIVNTPGIIIDLGTWRGQTAVICENLRAIFEPLHFNRRIIAFDTFTGYKGFSEIDNATEFHRDGTYSTGEDYDKFLSTLIELHEKSNAMGHNYGKHKVIKGDCLITLPKYFKEHPSEFVSLAFFDVNSYVPTLESFKLIYDKLVPGGIIAFWQLSREGKIIQAEGQVYVNEILNKYPHQIQRSIFYPGLCYIIK
ncbi:MAG: hypothetical protein H3C45_02980 [Bacteroidia bacterium]|nr:hypothetical protein [Bacteroidia bacterium]MCC7532410.1 hypothetical protein [Bacteroidia bacterium]